MGRSPCRDSWQRPGIRKHMPSDLGEALEDGAWRNRTPQHGELFLARLMTEGHFLPQVTCQLPRRYTSGLSQAEGLRWRKRAPAETVPVTVTDWGQEDPAAGLTSPQGVCCGELWSGGNKQTGVDYGYTAPGRQNPAGRRNLPGTQTHPPACEAAWGARLKSL